MNLKRDILLFLKLLLFKEINKIYLSFRRDKYYKEHKQIYHFKLLITFLGIFLKIYKLFMYFYPTIKKNDLLIR